MTKPFDLFFSGLRFYSDYFFPETSAEKAMNAYDFLPKNSVLGAIAGDMQRVGIQLMLAAQEKEKQNAKQVEDKD